MPYKFDTDKKLIPKELSRKIKLTEDQRQEIRDLYGKVSQRKLAAIYGVSRRLVVFIGCPEKYEKSKERRKINGKFGAYYDRDKQRVYAKKVRDYRKELNNKGLLIENNKI